jgi:Ni,Fe-hydrogenase III component G
MCQVLRFAKTPLLVGLAAELFDQCVDTQSIARQLAASLAANREPPDALLLAAFEAAHARRLDMHALFHDIENLAFSGTKAI